MAVERVFSVTIDGKSVNHYLNKDFDEIVLQSEGDSIWDYLVDTVSFTLDKSVLDLNFIYTPPPVRTGGSAAPVFPEATKINEFNLDLFENKIVKIYYYDHLILLGIVGEISYDFINEDIDFEVFSIGKVISELDIYKFTTNETILTEEEDVEKEPTRLNGERQVERPKRDDIYSIKTSLISAINELLERKGLNFLKLESDAEPGYSNRTKYTNFKNITYQSLNGEEYEGSDGVHRRLLRFKGDEDGSNGPRFIRVRFNPIGEDEIYQLLDTGEIEKKYDISDIYKLAGVDITLPDSPGNLDDISNSFINATFEEAEDFEEDGAVIKYIIHNYHHDNKKKLRGQAITGKYYWAIVGGNLYRLTLKDELRFLYTYTNKKVGNIQADFAQLLNDVTWVGSDRHMYLLKRDRINNSVEGIASAEYASKNVIELSYDVVNQSDKEVQLPEEIEIVEKVKQKIISDYSKYVKGKFHAYKILIFRDQFSKNEYPLMLRDLKVRVRGKTINVGIIKKVTYKEDVIEFETLKRVSD